MPDAIQNWMGDGIKPQPQSLLNPLLDPFCNPAFDPFLSNSHVQTLLACGLGFGQRSAKQGVMVIGGLGHGVTRRSRKRLKPAGLVMMVPGSAIHRIAAAGEHATR